LVIGTAVVVALVAMANAVVFHGVAPSGLPVPPLVALLFIMHGLAAFAGGYAAAAIARRRPRTHGVAVGMAYVLVVQFAPPSLINAPPPSAHAPFWFTAAVTLIALAATTLGAAARAQDVSS
jgi:hypothetical protein